MFKNLFKIKNLKFKIRRLSKRTVITLITIILVILPTIIFILQNAKSVSAVWFNDDYAYRYPITITNSTGAVQTNLQKLLTIDTSTLVTAGKLLSTCADLRFTDNNGKVIPYYIDSGCNTTTTKVWVYIWNIPTNGSVIYMYYGNPGAKAGSNSQPYFDNLVGLVGYWTLNDGGSSSTASDSSVNANTGTLSIGAGGTQTTTTQAWTNGATGKYSTSLNFDGTDDFVNLGTPSSLNITSNMTIAVWIKPAGSGRRAIFSNYNVAGNRAQYHLEIGPDNRLYVWSDGAGTSGMVGSTVLVNSSWYHVEAVYLGSSVWQLYVNGVAEIMYGTSSFPATSSFGNTTIGKAGDFSGGLYFQGQIDDLLFYNTARTAAQIKNDYTKTYTIQTSPLTVTTSSGSEEKAPSPVAYWKFDEGTGTTAKDSTTNANNGTLSGSTLPAWQTEDMCVSGKCLYFDGTSSKVTAPDSKLWDFGTNDFAIGMWTKLNSYGSSGTMLLSQQSGAGVGGFEWWISTSGIMRFNADNGTNLIAATLPSSPLNTWTHFMVTRSGTTFSIYMNGKLVGTSTSSTAVTNVTGVVNIGSYAGGASTFGVKGFIDEIKIYPGSRTAAQIQADYNSRANNEGAGSVLGTASNNNPAALSNGLVGYWKMDESSWNGTASEVKDASGNGNNGTSSCAGTGCTVASTGSGKFGNSASLNGTAQYAQATTTTNLKNTTYTISSWINTPSLAAAQDIFGLDDHSVNTGFRFLVLTSGELQLLTGPSWNGYISSGAGITTNTWYHVVLVVDSSMSTVKMYVNGVQKLSTTLNANTIYSTPRMTVGADYDSNITNSFRAFFNGKIDEARIYNRALSPAEVSQLYNFAPGPKVYLKMDEGSGTTANDSSGNANTGTVNNGTWSTGKYGKGVKVNGTTGSDVSVPDFGY